MNDEVREKEGCMEKGGREGGSEREENGRVERRKRKGGKEREMDVSVILF